MDNIEEYEYFFALPLLFLLNSLNSVSMYSSAECSKLSVNVKVYPECKVKFMLMVKAILVTVAIIVTVIFVKRKP